jgi:hypothetical protein
MLTWILRVGAAFLLGLIAVRAASRGQEAFLSQHFTYAYDREDDDGRRSHVVLEYRGGGARRVGAGLQAVALVAAIWILPLLWPGWSRAPVRRDRFLRLSLGATLAALLMIWPPWRIPSSGIAVVTWLFIALFAAWRRLARGIKGRRRQELRGRVLLSCVLGVNALGFLFFGVDAFQAAWFGAFLGGVVVLHFSMELRARNRPAGEAGRIEWT